MRYLKNQVKKLLSFLVIVSFLTETFSVSAFGQVIAPPALPAVFTTPVLKYLSVNSANPYNYFNFLVENKVSRSAGEPVNPKPAYPLTNSPLNYTPGVEFRAHRPLAKAKFAFEP